MKKLVLEVGKIGERLVVIDTETKEQVKGLIDTSVKRDAFANNSFIIVDEDAPLKSNGCVNHDYISFSATNKVAPEVKKVENPTMKLITASYKAKNPLLKVSELKWKILARNVLKNKNTMLVGPSGCGKTSVAIEVAKSLDRPNYIANFGSTQDPRSSLIGQNQYNKEQGTFFQESNFIKALETENCVIVLDELSRAHPEAFNIVLPLLDFQKTLRIEETNRLVTVADGVSFVATANIGLEYTSTRTMDRALIDRFIPIEIDFISKSEEKSLIKTIHADLHSKDADNIVNFVDLIRKELSSVESKITTHISTRVVIEIAGLCADGFSLYDAVVYTVLPNFDKDGGVDSERTFILQVLQKFVTKDDDGKKVNDVNDVKTKIYVDSSAWKTEEF